MSPGYARIDVSAHWKELRALVAGFDVRGPGNLAPLPPTGPPHALLKKYSGWLCSCGVAEVDRDKAAVHRQECTDGSYRSCAVQTWFERSHWFPVSLSHPQHDSSSSRSLVPESGRRHLLESAFAASAASAGLDPSTLAMVAPSAPAASGTNSPWLRKTRWLVLLDGVDLKTATDLIHNPGSVLVQADPGSIDLGSFDPSEIHAGIVEAVRRLIQDAGEDVAKFLAFTTSSTSSSLHVVHQPPTYQHRRDCHLRACACLPRPTTAHLGGTGSSASWA
ncbi:unnamed protein product [Tilletia laevis]|uniref:Uncharacterized protein n=1 Tax=Tilletia laevis TaxID=157183 RepID=A0A9N8QLF9_9BASI|nr:unnamed protein product [Tilletia laevis]